MVVLVGAYIKRFDVCVAAIVGFIARVVYTQTQEIDINKACVGCWSIVGCSVLYITNYADRWPYEGFGTRSAAKWMFVWVDFIYPQVEFYFKL